MEKKIHKVLIYLREGELAPVGGPKGYNYAAWKRQRMNGSRSDICQEYPKQQRSTPDQKE